MKHLLIYIAFCFPTAAIAAAGISNLFCYADTCGEFGPPHIEPGHIFCLNEEIYDLAALATSGGELFWYIDTTFTNAISVGNFCTPLNIVGTTTYYVVAIEGDCISEVGTVNVTIYPLPDVQIAPSSPIMLYPGDSLYLTSNFENNNLWSPFSENDSLLVTTDGEFILTVRDENYCFNSDTAYVELIDTTRLQAYHPLVFVPNAFTPDGDGVNDVFTIITHDIENFELQIYNRWGDIVFETHDTQNAWTGGDEYYCPDGQYFYSVKMDTGMEVLRYNGFVFLIR